MKKKIKILLLVLPYLLIALYFVYPKAFTIFHGFRIQTVSDMEEQSKLGTQETSNFFADSTSIRQSPLHSIHVGKQKYEFEQAEYDSAETFVNPLPPDKFVLARAKNRYEIYCQPCHGIDGKGNGLVITQPVLAEDEEGFPPPADLTSAHTVALSDGRLFHILSTGQNLMFRVNFKLNENDRWALVHYIRHLQYLAHHNMQNSK